MMKEIFKNGPIVVALNAAPDLYYYSSGVFITNPLNSQITKTYNRVNRRYLYKVRQIFKARFFKRINHFR